MIGVFVVDDHPIVAQGVEMTLEDEPDLRFVGSASTLAEAITLLPGLRPRIILLDVRLPDADVETAVRAIRRRAETAHVVLFTADPTHPHIRRARAAGAVATVPKDTSPTRLREIIRNAAAGRALAIEPDGGVLTPRQHDVLSRVAVGMTNAEIAHELGLKPTTVKAYWQGTMQRLDVRNRAEAIAAAYRRGLL